MSVIRNQRTAHFTITPNAVLRDERLSLQAKGLLALALSFPDDWAYSLQHLQGMSTNGRDAHRTALNELIGAGYAEWRHVQGDDGKLAGRELVISDQPVFTPADGAEAAEHRGPDNPALGTEGRKTRPSGSPTVGKPAPTKTERSTKTEGTKTVGGGEDARAREKRGDPRLLSDLEPLERISLGMTRQDLDAEVAGRTLAKEHREIFRALHRVRQKHRPDAVTWCEWVKAAARAADEHGPERLAAALDTALTTPHVRSPWALIEAVMRGDKPRPTGAGREKRNGDVEAALRARYPEAF